MGAGEVFFYLGGLDFGNRGANSGRPTQQKKPNQHGDVDGDGERVEAGDVQEGEHEEGDEREGDERGGSGRHGQAAAGAGAACPVVQDGSSARGRRRRDKFSATPVREVMPRPALMVGMCVYVVCVRRRTSRRR